MASVEKIVNDQEVETMIAEISKKWKAHRTKAESLSKAFGFITSDEFRALPVEVRVLVLKGAFYVNRTLPSSSSGGELE